MLRTTNYLKVVYVIRNLTLPVLINDIWAAEIKN